MQPLLGASRIGFGQNEPVSGDNRKVSVQCTKSRLLLVIPQASGRSHFDSKFLSAFVHCRLALAFAATGWPWRLRINRNDLMPGVQERSSGSARRTQAIP